MARQQGKKTPTVKLPKPDEGFEGLERFTDLVGVKEFYEFVRRLRTKTPDDIVNNFVAYKVGQEIVELLGRNPDWTPKEARAKVGKEWGFSRNNLQNFYNRIANPGYQMVTGRTIDEGE